MSIKAKDKIMALVMAAVVCIASPVTAWAFEPWTNVNGKWVGADGKTVIKEAVEKGITIGKYQNRAGIVNWKKLVLQDISFAMVRLGYYDDPDPYFDENMRGAQSVGIKTGVCFYGSASSIEAAKEEARYVLDIVKDYKVSYPIGYDIESSSLLELKLSKKQITEQVNAFCEVIEEAGYRVVVFGDYSWLTRHMDSRSIPYDIWYSRYGMSHQFQNRTLWRCTERASLDGIKGSVCLEFSFENYEDAFLGTGWRYINGNEYYFENYEMVKNTSMDIDGESYVFDADGFGILRNELLAE